MNPICRIFACISISLISSFALADNDDYDCGAWLTITNNSSTDFELITSDPKKPYDIKANSSEIKIYDVVGADSSTSWKLTNKSQSLNASILVHAGAMNNGNCSETTFEFSSTLPPALFTAILSPTSHYGAKLVISNQGHKIYKPVSLPKNP